MRVIPSSLKRRIIAALVLDRLRPNWPQESFLRRLLKRLEIDCVIDVGANIGQYAKLLRGLGFKGLILSFEPDTRAFEILAAKAKKDKSWFAFNVALGSKQGSAEMNMMLHSSLNSFRRPTEAETNVSKDYNKVIESRTVKVETLDHILPELSKRFGFKRPFLKMDTQGFDLEVYRGSMAVMDQVVAMQSELAILRIYEDTPPMQEVIREYRGSGFDVVALFPVNPADSSVIECDCYFARPNA